MKDHFLDPFQPSFESRQRDMPSNPATANLSMDEEENNENLHDVTLSRQQMDQPITCSANSLVNALRLSGYDVPEDLEASLIQKTLETRAPLDQQEDIDRVIAAYGAELQGWVPPPSEIPDLGSVDDSFARQLGENCVALLSVSSSLSKRDRDIEASVSFDDNPVLRGKNVRHRVVAQSHKGVVEIIDSYRPDEPTSFALTNPSDREKLSSWLISNGFQVNKGSVDPSFLGASGKELIDSIYAWAQEDFDPMATMMLIESSNVKLLHKANPI